MRASRLVIGACAALALHGARANAANDAAVTGIVEDSVLKPLAGAVVILHDSSGNTVAKQTTGADGKFTFAGIAFGDYTVEASEQGLVGDHQHIQLGEAELAPIELVLVNGEEVVTIHEDWSVPPPSKATGSVAVLSRQKMTELPGAEDRPITDVVSTQAGFVADGLGNVYARGNHANIQYQIDGIPIPDSVGSLFAASIPVRLLQNMEIYTGGIPAEFGDRLGAVVNLSTRQGTQQSDGTAQVRYGSYQTVEPGATYSTTVGHGSGATGVFIGGSYMYSQRALDPPSIDPILHDTGETGRVFLRLDRELTKTDRVEVFATYAHNKFDIPLDPSVGPLLPGQTTRPVDQYGNAAPPFIPHDTNATETENELFTAVSWVHTCTCNGDRTQFAPYYKLSSGLLFSDAPHALGATADPGSIASDVDRKQQHVGAVLNESITRGNNHLRAGAQTDYLIGSTSFDAYTRDDANPDGGIDPAATVHGNDNTDALLSGAYIQDSWSHGPWVVNGGIRVDELHVMLGDGTTRDNTGVSPRLGSSFQASKDVVLHAFTGVNWQPPVPTDATAAARALGIMPTAYDLKPETDLYAETGAGWRIVKALEASLTGWGRYAWNQLDDTAVGSTSLLSNYNFRRGRAVGVESNLNFRLSSWLTAFGNGSFEIAEGRGISSARYLFTPDQIANDSWQTLDHAQTWTANAGATVHDKRFTLSALAAYGSGLRTGADNTSHVPGHLRADLTMQYTFTPNGFPIRVGADVVNVFDDHYAYRIANGFVGSSYAAPREVFVSLSIPLSKEGHTETVAVPPPSE